MTPAYRDREQDILDARWLGDITNEQAAKLLEELRQDYYEARAILRLAQEAGQCRR